MMIGSFDLLGLAEALSRVTPEDAGTAEVMDKHWADANRHAAAELFKNPPEVSTWPAESRKHELAYQLVKRGRLIRNEYLAKHTKI